MATAGQSMGFHQIEEDTGTETHGVPTGQGNHEIFPRNDQLPQQILCTQYTSCSTLQCTHTSGYRLQASEDTFWELQLTEDGISNMEALPYFVNAETTLQTDASKKGLRACLIQKGKVVCYASRALAKTEQNYQNLEWEALGTIWGMEKFHYFLYGKEFTLETDQKPLVSIYKKHMVDISSRVQRLIVRSFPYLPFKVVYKKGIDIPVADALSQMTPMDPEDNIQLPIIAVNMISTCILMSVESQNSFSNKLDRLRKSTAQDNQLTRLSHYINIGFPCDKKNLLTDEWILATQGNTISWIWTHYMWQQDHSSKGDETWNAPVHTWGTSRQRKMSTLGKEYSILAQNDFWCTGTHRKMYNMPGTWEITTNHWYYSRTSTFPMTHIGNRYILLEKNGLSNSSWCIFKILLSEETGQLYICSHLCRTSHHCNRIRLTPHHQEWQWTMLQFQGMPAISAMIQHHTPN